MDHSMSPNFSITIQLFEIDGRTRMEGQNVFETITDFKQAVETFKIDESLKQNIDRLVAYLNNFIR